MNFTENLLSEIWVYNKTCYFCVCIWDCNITWIYKQRLASKHKSFSLSNLHSSTVLPISPFFGEKCTLPHILKNKQNTNSHPFYKVGEIQLWIIKTICFTYLLLILIPQYGNMSGDGTGGYMLQKNRIGR